MPIKDDQVPLKQKVVEEHLQSNFFCKPTNVLQRTVDILEEITALTPMKTDVIRSVSLQDEKESKEKFKALRQELNWLSSLEFNRKNYSAKMGKILLLNCSRSGPNAVIKQHAAPHSSSRFKFGG